MTPYTLRSVPIDGESIEVAEEGERVNEADPATKLSSLDLNLLRILDVLLTEQSVQHAAARLKMTPSGVSRALGRLREAFGDPLLVRNGRFMNRTSLANALQRPLARIMADIARLFAPQEKVDPQTARFTLRISGSDYTEHVLIAVLAASLAQKAPGVDVQSVRSATPAMDLENDRLDIVIDLLGAVEGPDIVASRLIEDGFVVVLREGHPALQKPWTPERWAACEHVLVAPGGRPGGVVDEVLKPLGLNRRVRALVSTFTAPMPIVCETDLVATMPARMAAQFAPRWPVVVRPPPVDIGSFVLGLHWLEGRRRDPVHLWCREQLRATAARLPPYPHHISTRR